MPSALIAPDQLRLSVAPMMDWTDTHCRVFHRLLAPRARLYTEMVHANAVTHGDRARLLARPSFARAVEEARPFRAYFPLGAPDRD